MGKYFYAVALVIVAFLAFVSCNQEQSILGKWTYTVSMDENGERDKCSYTLLLTQDNDNNKHSCLTESVVFGSLTNGEENTMSFQIEYPGTWRLQNDSLFFRIEDVVVNRDSVQLVHCVEKDKELPLGKKLLNTALNSSFVQKIAEGVFFDLLTDASESMMSDLLYEDINFGKVSVEKNTLTLYPSARSQELFFKDVSEVVFAR